MKNTLSFSLSLHTKQKTSLRDVIKCATLMIIVAFAAYSHEAYSQPAKHNNSGPIEITADTLAVDQKDGTATFSGNVDAKQGNIRIKSQKMVVTYTSGPQAKPSSANQANAISKVTLSGNITITSADDTAQGGHGIYDVKKQLIYLNDSVILSQGKNIVKGDKLVYNVATGKSEISGGNDTTTTSASKKSGGRVKGIFVPQKNSD